jgi:hypothetical protein
MMSLELIPLTRPTPEVIRPMTVVVVAHARGE